MSLHCVFQHLFDLVVAFSFSSLVPLQGNFKGDDAHISTIFSYTVIHPADLLTCQYFEYPCQNNY